MKKFCDNCLKEVKCEYKERNKELKYKDKIVYYLEKYYVCSECKSEFYDDLYDYNIRTGNNELKKAFEIITIDEIKNILEKYNIGKKPFSLILGLGEITITRYLEGQNPTKEISDLLKNISKNPILYEMYLEANKDKITSVAYKKTLGKAKQIELLTGNSKLYNYTLYIINKMKEVDPLSIQKILYFANGFSNKFLNHNLFNNEAQAWIYGPVYSDIYDALSYYQSKKIDYNELVKDIIIDISSEEMNYIDYIIKYFGCYSGSILREMTHLTDPWINAREGLAIDEASKRIITIEDTNNYFDKISKKYKMKNIEDIQKYATKLFEIVNN